MKWSSLLKDIKEKVGLSQSSPSSSPASSVSGDPVPSPKNVSSVASSYKKKTLFFTPSEFASVLPSLSKTLKDRHELELDFKRFWEEFRSSSSEKEKEMALNMAIDSFCRLVRQQANATQLITTLQGYLWKPAELVLLNPLLHVSRRLSRFVQIQNTVANEVILEVMDFDEDSPCNRCLLAEVTSKYLEEAVLQKKSSNSMQEEHIRLVEAHIFSFVVGRAFVTDVEKLKSSGKSGSLHVVQILNFFEVKKEGISPGSNLLSAVQALAGLIDKQPLLDSGILCCLIHILNTLLSPDDANERQLGIDSEEFISPRKSHDVDAVNVLQPEVEGSIVYIMKALASHPSAAQSLIEDNSLQLLFQMVATGSLTVFYRFKLGLVPLHTIQLYRHAMQILGLLLVNDNGSTAKYIHKHHLIKILLMAVKDFNPEAGDSAYTMGIVDLLLECVELSYRPEAGAIKLREDIHNAHGYQFLVQFALVLSTLQNSQVVQSHYPNSEENSALDGSVPGRGDVSPPRLSPSLSRLLDVLVNLAQTGPVEAIGGKGPKSTNHRASGLRSYTPSMSEGIWEKGNTKVRDLEAVQMLQDIFLKANSIELQAEVLNRMFKIFSSHIENYKICQELRTVPLLILNMEGFPPSLQEKILKILEYAVTVVNCVPEQELLSLCCLLQQPITSGLKNSILSFFVKLLSFDQQYKKVLREVGVMEVLLDDLKQHKHLSGTEQHKQNLGLPESMPSSSSFNKHRDIKDAILSSPRIAGPDSAKFSMFEDESTINVAWNCLASLLKKAEANQSSFRVANGVTIVLPFLASDVHRPGVLRLLSCLIIEDVSQVHPEELGALIEVLKSGMVTSILGSQYRLQNDAKCDTLGALWRILGVNNSAQRVFGEATGFSLLLTMLSSFPSDGENADGQSSLLTHMKVFSFLLRVVTAGACDNFVNRLRLHAIISSQTFYDLLCESGLLCVDYEKQVIQLLLELALEIALPPSVNVLQVEGAPSFDITETGGSVDFLLSTTLGTFKPDKERVYNAGAVGVLIRSLLLFTPKVQLGLLNFIELLARAGPFNQENLTSIGCVGLLLDTIHPFLTGSSPILSHALRIVEVLGAYRLSSLELRVLVRYILQMKLINSGHILVEMMERLVHMEEMTMETIPLAPFIEMDMRKIGCASIQVSLGERTWPPAAGYSFVCWFQYRNFLKKQLREPEQPSKAGKHNSHGQQTGGHVLRIFTVSAGDDSNTSYAELYLQDDGVLTLATSNSSSLSFSGLEMEEGRWHHLAVVHSKPNAFAGLFQASVAHVYLNGKLRHTGKLGYAPSPMGKSLQVTIGTPSSCARIVDLSWRLRCCYLFEEVLTSGSICFMYILGRGYRGLFQDTDLLRFVPNEACGGGSMSILDSLDAELPLAAGVQKLDSVSKQGNLKMDGSGIVWDLERLGNLSLQLSGKKLIFAFDGTSSEAFRASGTLSMLNLVDPMSAAASPIGGIPRFGRLYGDIYICSQCVIGDSIRTIGGMAVVLALVEAAETREMLHMALSLLACALRQSPQNARDMQAYRGYHLLALFLHRRMSLFDLQSLDIFFQIAACEAFFSEPQKFEETQISSSLSRTTPVSSFEDSTLPKFSDELSSSGSPDDLDDFVAPKDSLSHLSELENSELQTETSNCIVLANADMVEHVLLDWTLWVTAPIAIQIALLGFLERLVSMHWYRNHNLTVLRKINLVQHLLVTLQRGDVEVPVLEKLVVLLGVILEDGFLTSELEHVVRFVIMTLDPPEMAARNQIVRESMGKYVIVRNMLLEMFIDLQATINSEELLEQWHKIVSSKLITYFLDEAVHPTSMRRIMTLLGVSLTSSPTFVLKFRSSGGYQGLTRVLPSFYDSPEIYYILFCLILGKPVLPSLPEVRMLDFHALIPSNGYGELKFIELLDSVIAMVKATFDRLSMQSMVAHQTGVLSQVTLASELDEGMKDTAGEFPGEALMHKTYAARLMGGDAAAPATGTSVLRFMVDLAKMCYPFSAACRRTEFLESCVDLYFSCARAACAVKMTKDLSIRTSEEKNLNDSDDTHSSQHTFSSLPHEHEQSTKTSISIGSFPQGQKSTSSEDILGMQNYKSEDKTEKSPTPSKLESSKAFMGEDGHLNHNFDGDNLDQMSTITAGTHESSFHINDDRPEAVYPADSFSSVSVTVPNSPALSEKSNIKIPFTPSSSPVIALTSWLGSSGNNDGRAQLLATPSMSSSVSMSETDQLGDSKSSFQGLSVVNAFFTITPKLLLEIEEAGSGGGPCSAGACSILDFLAEVLADIATEQIKGALVIESILETVPLYVDADSMLVFQGLCLSRLMNFLERRLLRDDEESEKKLDKSRWSVNLDTLCWMIVDRVYMGAFPEPSGVFRTLEFLLSMLQFANKDGRIEEAAPTGKGLLSITRGTRQLEMYMHALLKNTNRMIMYCFFPSFLITIGEEDFLSSLCLQVEPRKGFPGSGLQDASGNDICTVLQLLIAHKRLIICPSNLDTDIICCLCINLIALLRDQRRNAQNMAMDIIRYLLVHRRAALEEFLVSKLNQGQYFDVIHGGFDKLLTSDSSAFFQWLQSSDHIINKVLEQCAAIMWVQYIAGSAKFPGVRIKGMEGRRKREMLRRSRDASRLDLRHWEQLGERRYALELVREAMSTELRVVRQDKYGWVLHAESEWQTHLQQLVHERGIYPIKHSSFARESEWQLCPIEGPYRMRKKLEQCKLKIDTIQNLLNRSYDLREEELDKEHNVENGLDISETDIDSIFHLLSGTKQKCSDGGEYEENSFKEAEEFKDGDSTSARVGWNDDQCSSINEASLHSALESGVKSSAFSVQITDSINIRSDPGSPWQSSSARIDDMKATEDKSEKEVYDNGEYLIRPYLEPLEKIRSRYNCERVVGLDKHDGIFLIGEFGLYVIENFYIDSTGCICEKLFEDELSVIDQALGVMKDVTGSAEFQSKSPSWELTVKASVGGRAWAYNGGAWGKEKVCNSGNLPHPWNMWKLDSVHEILKRDYQLRPVAIEIFSMDGCNDLLVFHKREREEVFKNLIALNLPRNSMLDTTISGSTKQESNEGSRLFKIMAKSFSKRWQNGEISNFQYLMHLNTLAGRGYNDLTQYPVFPWVLADYESETLNMTNPDTFRKLDKPMGCQTAEGEEEFKKRYESWDDPDVPKFHYGSHYSSAGIVLFYLLRLPPFSTENQKLQGGQFDHADRLFNSVRDTWFSAAGKGNTSDVKELVPEFFYMSEFLENRFNLDLGEKQSGEKVGDVVLPPWAKGSAREFIRKHREALESDYVSDNLHHWIDLIFGYKQRGKAAEEAVNVFYHYTYEGNVDIDAVSDPAMKASILAQINHFGQTPKQLFLKPHVKRRSDRKLPLHMLHHCSHLVPHEIRRTQSPVSQILTFHEKILVTGPNTLLKPRTYSKYLAWGFPDRSLRFISYDQDKLLSTHENLHGGNQVQCAGVSRDGQILVTGADDGVVSVWRVSRDVATRGQRRLHLKRTLCAHTDKITCLYVSQAYTLIISGSDDCTVIIWDLSSLVFVMQLPKFPASVSAVHVNDLTGEIVTAAGIMLAVWSINGDCLAVVNTSQLPSDFILSVTSPSFSDWFETNWYVTGHQSGAVKVWHRVHCTDEARDQAKPTNGMGELGLSDNAPEYRLVLYKVLKSHKHPITALHMSSDMKQLLSGDSGGHLMSWTLPDESFKT